MTSTTLSHHTTRRPALDVAVERVALGLLRWSSRRTELTKPSHERVALLLENERACKAGSPIAR